MKIRKATEKDALRILELLNSDPNLVGDEDIKFSPYHVKEYLSSPITRVYIVEKDKKVIGLVISEFWKTAKYAYINQVVVDKDYRRRGIGKALMKFIENLAKKEKMNIIFCFSEVDNKKTHKLFGKLNYKKGKRFFFFSKSLR